MSTPHHKSKSASTVHEGHLCKFHALVHSLSGDKRWAVREAAGRNDRIWVLASAHSAQLPMSSASDPQTRRPSPLTPAMAMIGESDGLASKMPSVSPKHEALLKSRGKSEALICLHVNDRTVPCDKNHRACSWSAW